MPSKQILTAVTTKAAPTTAAHGVSLGELGYPDSVLVLVTNPAGTDTPTVTLRAWVYSSVSGKWHPAGIGSNNTTKGRLNAGNVIGENTTGGSNVNHVEVVANLRDADRFDLSIEGALGGTGTTISAWITARDRGER